MEQLSSEVAFNILLNIPVSTLLKACRASSLDFNIRKSDYFWREKTAHDFGLRYAQYEGSAFEFYMKLASNEIKYVPVYYKDTLLGRIWIRKDQDPREITQEIRRLFVDRYPDVTGYKVVFLAHPDKRIMGYGFDPYDPLISIGNQFNFYMKGPIRFVIVDRRADVRRRKR